MPSTTKASRKYNEKNYDRLYISVKKGQKAQIEAFAESHNESLNSFVNRAIDETMQRDKEKADF